MMKQDILSIISIFISILTSLPGIYRARNHPAVKKMISGIKRSSLFAVKYIVPVCNLIFLYKVRQMLDAMFLFSVVFLFSILMFNLIIDVVYVWFKRMNRQTDEMFVRFANLLNDSVELGTRNTSFIRKLLDDLSDKHAAIQGLNRTVASKAFCALKKKYFSG